MPTTAPPSPAFLKKFFKRDRFAARTGIRLLEVGRGRAVARMALTGDHLNGVEVAQGGALFTLADLAFAAACNSHGPLALAVEVSISFVAPATRGPLTATATEVTRSARLSRVEVVVTDGGGVPVALFHGTAYVTRESLVEAVAAPRRPAGARPTRRRATRRP